MLTGRALNLFWGSFLITPAVVAIGLIVGGLPPWPQWTPGEIAKTALAFVGFPLFVFLVAIWERWTFQRRE